MHVVKMATIPLQRQHREPRNILNDDEADSFRNENHNLNNNRNLILPYHTDFTIPTNIFSNVGQPTTTARMNPSGSQSYIELSYPTEGQQQQRHHQQKDFRVDIENGCAIVAERKIHGWLKDHCVRSFSNWKKTKANCGKLMLILMVVIILLGLFVILLHGLGNGVWSKFTNNPLWFLTNFFITPHSSVSDSGSPSIRPSHHLTGGGTKEHNIDDDDDDDDDEHDMTKGDESIPNTEEPIEIKMEISPRTPYDRGKGGDGEVSDEDIDGSNLFHQNHVFKNMENALTDVILYELSSRLNEYLWELSIDLTREILTVNQRQSTGDDSSNRHTVNTRHVPLLRDENHKLKEAMSNNRDPTLSLDAFLIVIQLNYIVKSSILDKMELELNFKHKGLSTIASDHGNDDDYPLKLYKTKIQDSLTDLLVSRIGNMFIDSTSYRCCCHFPTGTKCSTKQTKSLTSEVARTKILNGKEDFVCQLTSTRDRGKKEEDPSELYMSVSARHLQSITENHSKCTLQLITEEFNEHGEI